MTAKNDPDRRDDGRRWRPRPLLALALRLLSVLIPAAAGAATAYLFVAAVPIPNGLAVVPWFLVLAALSTVATAIAERIGRRFLPLAVLLKLSLVFPDRAPSRFAMARGAGNVRRLEQRIRDARETGVDPEPARAAEQILALVAALSAHDRKTRGHSERVRAFTDLLAGELRIPEEDRDRLRWAALLHDVGKLDVPTRILNKPGRPEPWEWERLKGHPAAGAEIAAPLLPWLGPWGGAIVEHHERFDGEGYPNGIDGEAISLAGRIVTVADSFEVMTAARSYKKPMSVPAARRELAACAGGQFDPGIVRAFLNVSLGRLWWAVGPASWTALLPVIGPVQRAGGEILGAARAGAAALAVATGGMLSIATGAAAASQSVGGSAVVGQSYEPLSQSAGSTVDASTEVTPGSVGPGTSGGGSTGSGVDPTAGGGGADGGEDPTPPIDDPGGTIGGVVDGTTGVVDEATGVVDGAAGVVDGTTAVVDGAVTSATDTVSEVVHTATEVLETGAAAAVDQATSDVTDAVSDTADQVTDLAGKALGI